MVYPHRHPAPRPALNATAPSRPQPDAPDRAERKAQHLRLCQELIEIGMALARAAAERAMADMAAAPPSTPLPCSSAAAIEQAEERARHRTPDYGRVFTHVSRAVRQTILLESHILDGRASAQHTEARPDSRTSSPETETEPQPETLRRDTVEQLDCELTAGPEDDEAVEALLQTISSKFGHQITPAHTPPAAAPPANPGPRPHHPARSPQKAKPGTRPTQNAARQPGHRW